jgi:pyruvate dehydrogenase E1 component beta subunit
MMYRTVSEEVPIAAYTTPLGKAAIRREGADITAVAWGPAVEPILRAAEAVAEVEGIQVEVIDLRTLQPWDVECVEASVRKTGRLLVTHEVWAAHPS